MRKDSSSNGVAVHLREPRPDGDLKKPRIMKCNDSQDIMNLLSGVRWEHIRLGIMEASLSRSDSLVPALAYLAKHGWNDMQRTQSEAREEQFKNIAAILLAERLEQEGKVGRSTVGLAIPHAVMTEIRGSADPARTAQELRERINAREKVERSITRKRAIEALGEIGTPAAIAVLVKMLSCAENNADMRAASALNHFASANPKDVPPVLKEAIKSLENRGEAEKVVQILEAACERIEGKA